MSQYSDTDTSQPLSTTSARLVAVRMKSANKHIFRALLSLASANLLIRVMGMVNQVVVSARFGQGEQMDAYYVASAVPVLLAQLLASGLEASVIPIYSRVRTSGGREQASRLFSSLLNLLVIAMVAFTIFMLVFRYQLVIFSAPGLQTHPRDLATDLTPYIFPVLILMVMNSFMECLLNSEGQFGWPAYAGILVPLTTATLVLLEGKSHGVLMLCIGTIAGQCFQLGIVLVRASRAKLRYQPIIDIRDPNVIEMLKVAWPYLFGSLISQASPLVDQIFASSLTPGSITALNNALKLTSVPTGVIFSSIGRAALPYLARQAAVKDMKAFKDTLRLYSWAVGVSTFAISLVMIVLAHPIIELIFQHGSFHEEDTRHTASTLIGFAIGLTPMALGFILSRAMSALGKSKQLMFVTIFSVFANAVFDYVLGKFFQSFGIALATSAVYCCTVIILTVMLRAQIGRLYFLTPPHEVLKVIWRVGLGPYYVKWVAWKDENFLSLPYHLRQQIIRACFVGIVFVAGVVGAVSNGLLTVSIAFGSIIVLYLLRYRYYLLIAWVLLTAFIGSNISFFNGAHFLSGLTVPSVLLLFYLPTKQALIRMRALGFFLAFTLWILLGVGISPLPASQFFTVWSSYVNYFSVAVLTVLLVTTRQRMLRLIDVILVPAVCISIYGIYGYFTKQNGLIDASTKLFRISSVFGNTPPTLAMFLSIIIPLAIYRTSTLQGYKRLYGLPVIALFLITLALTFTRGAFLSVPLAIVVMVLFLPSKRLKAGILSAIATLVGVLGLVAAVGNLPVFSRFLNQDITTLNGRTLLWQAIINHFAPSQLLGYGLKGSDDLLTNLHVGVGRGVIATAAHNIFLETLYDHGIIGLTLLLLALVTLAGSLLSKTRRASVDHRMMLAMALAIFFNVMVQSIESNDIWNQSVGIYFWIIMALPFALCWANSEQKKTSVFEAGQSNKTTDPALEIAQPAEQKELSHA